MDNILFKVLKLSSFSTICFMNRKWLSGSYGVSSLNIGLSRLAVPLKIKEMYVENIWATVQVCSYTYLVSCFCWSVALQDARAFSVAL